MSRSWPHRSRASGRRARQAVVDRPPGFIQRRRFNQQAVEGAGRDGDDNEHAMSEEAGAAAMTAELWATLNAKMMTYLQSITLETLVSEQRARGVEVERKPARRGIYKQPQSEPVRPTTPNSVFALGGLLLSGR